MTIKKDSKPDSDLLPGLYIIATPIGNMGDITFRAVDTLRKADVVACEDTRVAGKLVAAYGLAAERLPYHDHNAEQMRPRLVDKIRQGGRVALISDAGTPLISDPGYKLVQDCLAADLYVTTLPGASASLAALVLSGLPGDRFMFAGFPPPKTAARKAFFAEVKDVPATLIFYETAPRLAESLLDMREILGDRPAAVARELTKKFEEIRRDVLSVLADHYNREGLPRGEIAVVVGPPSAHATEDIWTDARIETLLDEMMDKEGMSVRDAAAFVAARSGRRKGDVYQLALLIRNRKGRT